MKQRASGGFVLSRLIGYATRLRFPKLLALTVLLFLADLAVPDTIPFIDEILLGLTAALLSVVRRKRVEERQEPGPSNPEEERR